AQADAEFYKAHPELSGRKLTADAADAALRKEWSDLYRKAQSNGEGVAASASAGTATRATNAGGRPGVKDNIAIAADPWLRHFEADAKDPSGKTVHYIVDGKMENLGAAYARVITGTWKVGNQVGSFKVIRN